MCAAAALLAGLNELAANFLRHYPQYKSGAFNLTELARLCDISRTTAYKYINTTNK
jgi:response regulator of citrate/malate metabolism